MMRDTQFVLIGSMVAFVASAAIGIFYAGRTSKKILTLAFIGLAMVAGYLAIFAAFPWPWPIETQKLVAFFILTFPGFFCFYFLPIFPGYFLGKYLKNHFRRASEP